MSQRWHTTDRYTVLVGYDRPLQGYFAVVWDRDADPDRNEPLWSNLVEPWSHPQTFEPWASVLRERFGVELPVELVSELEADARREAGPLHPLADFFSPADA